ncbi:tail fiber domain-containing protein [Ichthyobacterium seriolicida]|nr:tail fiber domain-containing protein [Ichthyobacterium seriolicida]
MKTYLRGTVVLEEYSAQNISGIYFGNNMFDLPYEDHFNPFSIKSGSKANISLHSKGSILTEEKFVATSDKRVKSIKGISDRREDLKKLLDIEITDYTMIDSIESGVKPFKKVIAQQIENIVPEVIDINKGIIPNVYELAKSMSISNEGSAIKTDKVHNFSVGDLVKIIIESEGSKEVKVKAVIDSNTFLIEEVLDSKNKVFVYGKEVDDMRSVDYDGLTTLNISATQAIYEELLSTKKELSSTKEKLDTLIKLLSKSNILNKEDTKALIKK